MIFLQLFIILENLINWRYHNYNMANIRNFHNKKKRESEDGQRGRVSASAPPPVVTLSTMGMIGKHNNNLPNKQQEELVDNEDVEDMTSKASTTGISDLGRSSVTENERHMMVAVKSFVATNIFAKMKFITNKDVSLRYDTSTTSICGFVIRGCGLNPKNELNEWWAVASKWVWEELMRIQNDKNTALKMAFHG